MVWPSLYNLTSIGGTEALHTNDLDTDSERERGVDRERERQREILDTNTLTLRMKRERDTDAWKIVLNQLKPLQSIYRETGKERYR